MSAQLKVSEPSDFILRDATKSDLDDITRIHVEGFEEEPLVNYCYPLRHQYPDDYRKWTRKEYENYIDQPQKYKVHVVDAVHKYDGRSALGLMGLAVWDISVTTKAIGADPGLNERRDANKVHCEAFRDAAGRRFDNYFPYGDKQMYLSVLVVHPDFRRRGVGTLLVNWGIKVAEEKEWPVTLCASPMGQLLYKHLKFEVIDIEVVRVEGEEETLRTTIMVRGLDGSHTADIQGTGRQKLGCQIL